VASARVLESTWLLGFSLVISFFKDTGINCLLEEVWGDSISGFAKGFKCIPNLECLRGQGLNMLLKGKFVVKIHA